MTHNILINEKKLCLTMVSIEGAGEEQSSLTIEEETFDLPPLDVFPGTSGNFAGKMLSNSGLVVKL